MKQKSIYFHGPPAVADEQVRACRDGRMTQHRIPIRPQPLKSTSLWWEDGNGRWDAFSGVEQFLGSFRCPFGPPGTVLAIKEAWGHVYDYDGQVLLDGVKALYRAGASQTVFPNRWRPPQHMPLEFVRMQRRIVRVWVHKVQDITPEDALAEGVLVIENVGSSVERVKFHPDLDRLSKRNQDEWFQGQARAVVISQCDDAQRCVDAFRKDIWDAIYGKTEFAWEKNSQVFACEWEVVK